MAEEYIYNIDRYVKLSDKKPIPQTPKSTNSTPVSIGDAMLAHTETNSVTLPYTVAKGDNFTKIARKYNVSLEDLKKANPNIRDFNLIKIGQKINIPQDSTQPQKTNIIETAQVNPFAQASSPQTNSEKRFNEMLEQVLKFEGGYSNHKSDPGGATNKGITQDTYNDYLKKSKKGYKDVKYITDEEVKEIYYKNYYLASGADKIKDPALAYLVFDTAVNMGVGRAKKLYEQCDGSFDKYIKLRKQAYENIIKKRPSSEKFRKGWFNRLNTIEEKYKKGLL